MRKLLATTAAVLVLGAGSAVAAMSDWDADGNASVSRAEFDQHLGESFAEYDADEDGTLSGDELGEVGGFENIDSDWSAWDQNTDSALSEEEFGEGLFTNYDQDSDSAWSETEYEAAEEDDWF